MTLTAPTSTPFFFASAIRSTPGWVRPSGITGRVKETSRPGWAFCSWAMAWERRELAAVSGSAPPSMSKSTLVSS